MKHPKILKLICIEQCHILIKQMLIKVLKKMNINRYYFHYVIFIVLYWVERNLEHKVGLEYIILMMEI